MSDVSPRQETVLLLGFSSVKTIFQHLIVGLNQKGKEFFGSFNKSHVPLNQEWVIRC